MSGDILIVTVGGLLLTFSEESTVVLNILQCLGQSLQQKITWPKMSVVLLLGNLGLGDYEKAARMGNCY